MLEDGPVGADAVEEVAACGCDDVVSFEPESLVDRVRPVFVGGSIKGHAGELVDDVYHSCATEEMLEDVIVLVQA